VQGGPASARPTGALQLPLRGLLAAGLAVLIGLTGSVTGVSPTAPESAAATPTATSADFAAAVPSPTITAPGATDLMSGPTGPTIEARVIRVLDGATIVVALADTQYEVRYIGVESAGTSDAPTPAASIGPQASAANTALVAGRTVVLEKDVSEADQQGRLLRYVWLTDGVTWTLVNLELIKEGFASVATNLPDVKYVGLYLAAERKAQANGAGLWREDPTPKPRPTPKPQPTHKPKPTPKAKLAPNCHSSQDPCPPTLSVVTTVDVSVSPPDAAPVKVSAPNAHGVNRQGDGARSH
jgi:endonuclease YncB( thermonuclease family)